MIKSVKDDGSTSVNIFSRREICKNYFIRKCYSISIIVNINKNGASKSCISIPYSDLSFNE